MQNDIVGTCGCIPCFLDIKFLILQDLYGNDMNEDTTPIEAGLSWSVSKTKEEDYSPSPPSLPNKTSLGLLPF